MGKQKRVFKTDRGTLVHGVMAEFETPADILHAAEKIRDSGYTKWDVFAPFAIHGMDEAMGLKKTKLPLIIATIGLSGAALGYLFQWYVSQVLYPMVVQGKPPGAWEPFVPITFEIGILSTAFTTLIGMLAFNALPRYNHPLLRRERFLRAGDDRYFICIEAQDPKFDATGVKKMLEGLHAHHVELVEE